MLAVLIEDPEHEHTVHVVGETICDSTAVLKDGSIGRLAVVMSTEHELLNGWRIMQYGMLLQILIDTEYSLVLEGFGTMLIGVMSLSQEFHILAYAVVNHEDTEAHRHCLLQTKLGVEKAVRKYQGGFV